MAAAQEYDRLREAGDAKANDLLRRAAELEARAAEAVPRDVEPTRSVLFRSAATLARENGDTLAARRLATEGLRGTPPLEIKQELFDVLDRISRPSSPLAGLVQRVRVQSVRSPARSLDLAGLARIQQSWVELMNTFTGGGLSFVPTDVSMGSFVIQLELQRDDNDFSDVVEALHELHALSSSSEPGVVLDDRSAPAAKRWHGLVGLLTALADAGASLQVTTTGTGAETVATIEFAPPKRKVLAELQREASAMIPSENVPQADDLERVFRFVDLVAKGKYPTPEDLDVVPRQVNYYRRAAEILFYLRDRELTPVGGILTRLAGPARWHSVIANFSVTDVASAWITWNKKTSLANVDPDSAEAFLLARATGLSVKTIKRRAQTLRAWHTRLFEQGSRVGSRAGGEEISHAEPAGRVRPRIAARRSSA